MTAALIGALLGAIAASPPSVGQAAPGSVPRVLVMPFENISRDASIVWLREAAAVLVADDLNSLGAAAISRDERRQAFDRLQVPAAASLSDATIIRVGQIVGASQVVVGSIERSGDGLVVRARAIGLEAGRVQSTATETGAVADLFAIFARVARQLAPNASPAAAARPSPPSLPAFENYIKGLLAETPATQISYLTTAVKLQSDFDAARLALWDVYEEEGDHQRALEAVRPVAAESPVARRARFRAGLSELNAGHLDQASSLFRALAAENTTADVLNNLGVVQLRRGSGAQAGDPTTQYFRQAAERDPGDPDYFFNLGYAFWLNKDPQAAIYWLREAVRRDPADGDAHLVLSAALTAAGHVPEAAREKELASRLSSNYEQPERRSAGEAVPKGLERLKSDVELPHARRIETTLTTSGQRDQRDLARFYLDRGRRLFEQENDREAVDELNHAIYLSPYEAEAHLLLGRIHLRDGRIRDAIDALKISLWSAETVDAHIALGEAYLLARDTDAARSEAERALKMAPSSQDARQLLERIGPKPQ